MTKLFTIVLFFCVFTIQLTSQNNSPSEELNNNYTNFFSLNPETIYTQINKTAFFYNEELWFKTYIYDTKNQTPYISTTNIYINIYTKNENLILSKIYKVKNGVTNGNIKIDNLFPPGVYYIKTTTNWMKNFDTDNSHIQQFTVIDNNENTVIYNKETKPQYDFQLLPEGGHLINNTKNKVGFKVINNTGLGVKIKSGKVIDSDKNILTTFKSNIFGLGKFTINTNNSKKYFAQIILENGDSLTTPLPKSNDIGVGLSVENFKKDEVLIHVRTNKQTLKQLLNKHYLLAIHRDGFIENIEVSFNEDQLNYIFNIPKNKLLPGINIITLFNENNKVISERLLFNETSSPLKSISLQPLIKQKDSTIIVLKTDSKNINLSVSVLPYSNKSYNKNSTITYAFLLKPYIKGFVENPQYYFNNITPKKMYELDLLLLTQGWSRYSWESIFNNPPKIKYNFDTGFQIKGKLNDYNYKKSNRLLLSSKENSLHLSTDITEEGYFSFEKLYIKENSNLNFSLINKKDKQSLPKPYYNIFPNKFSGILNFNNSIIHNVKIHQPLYYKDNNQVKQFIDISDNILDTVTLKTVKSKPLHQPKNKPYGMTNNSVKYLNFSDSNALNSPITDQIRNNGFEVAVDVGEDLLKIFSRRKRNLDGYFSPQVYLDYALLDPTQFNLIRGIRQFDVEEMFISNEGSIYGSPGGVIHIFLKSSAYSKTRKNTFSNRGFKYGYSEADEYYNPQYIMSHTAVFSKYGVINWIPNLTPDEKGVLSFKIPNYTFDSINLYIEGMGEDGSLYSTNEVITIE
ncbi:MAG: hypothetical protein QM478_06635 [Flavobacteriaceae bacterium]